jgi:hypothetical protein
VPPLNACSPRRLLELASVPVQALLSHPALSLDLCFSPQGSALHPCILGCALWPERYAHVSPLGPSPPVRFPPLFAEYFIKRLQGS